MRLVTRSDFDGLVCAVLLKERGLITEYKFAHPKDLQDGLIEVTGDDILANVPYVKGCGMWFDHHTSENERVGQLEVPGDSRPLPSCARVIWEYYAGHKNFSSSLDSLLDVVDKVDSGQLCREDIENPQGWVLLGFIMDPRTGLGRYRDYRISNYQLMEAMIEFCRHNQADEILAHPDVQERVKRYNEHVPLFKKMLTDNSKVYDKLVVTDLRNVDEIYCGNRFMLYTLYPDCNISMQIMWGMQKKNVVATLGYSILNRTCKINVGSLMLKYGGGGHPQVGTCQIPLDRSEAVLKELIAEVAEMNK